MGSHNRSQARKDGFLMSIASYQKRDTTIGQVYYAFPLTALYVILLCSDGIISYQMESLVW